MEQFDLNRFLWTLGITRATVEEIAADIALADYRTHNSRYVYDVDWVIDGQYTCLTFNTEEEAKGVLNALPLETCHSVYITRHDNLACESVLIFSWPRNDNNPFGL